MLKNDDELVIPMKTDPANIVKDLADWATGKQGDHLNTLVTLIDRAKAFVAAPEQEESCRVDLILLQQEFVDSIPVGNVPTFELVKVINAHNIRLRSLIDKYK